MAALGDAAGPRTRSTAAGDTRQAAPERPTASDLVDALQTIVAALPTGNQPALDDDPEGYTPAGQTAKAAQAERLARETEARRRTIRRRVLPVALLVVLALAAWLVGVAVGKLPGHSSGTPAAGSSASAAPKGAILHLSSVVDFDPSPGDGAEDPGGVPFAYDNKIATAWSTEDYYGSQWGGIAKSGVGLKVDLGKPVAVSQVRLLFLQPGVHVELRYSTVDGTSLDAYTVAATSGPNPGISQALSPRAGAYRYWLIWLTELPHQVHRQGTDVLGGTGRDEVLRLSARDLPVSVRPGAQGNADLLRSVIDRGHTPADQEPSGTTAEIRRRCERERHQAWCRQQLDRPRGE